MRDHLNAGHPSSGHDQHQMARYRSPGKAAGIDIDPEALNGAGTHPRLGPTSMPAATDNYSYEKGRGATEMDLDRISHPLRLAKGSHQPGSGKGCAMNVISYINGDTKITDFPACSARPLAVLVQCCNDLLAGPDGYLSPENSLIALDLAWQTVRTADVSDGVIHAWAAQLLTNPTWGVIRYAKITAVKAIGDVAELHRNAAAGDIPPRAAWDAADGAARAAARNIDPDVNRAGFYAIRAAYQSTALIHTHHRAVLDAVTGDAVRAHALASPGAAATSIVELSRHAIRTWRQLAGLDKARDDDPVAVDNLPQRTALRLEGRTSLAGAHCRGLVSTGAPEPTKREISAIDDAAYSLAGGAPQPVAALLTVGQLTTGFDRI